MTVQPIDSKSLDPQATADSRFHFSLSEVLGADEAALKKARKNYGESWCKRGGVGAFMMLARKWDRLENYLSKPPLISDNGVPLSRPAFSTFDILEAIKFDRRAEGLIDDVRDLRRYLALVEAKLVEEGYGTAEVKKN